MRPPVVVLRFARLPAVQRIAPSLSGFAESIWRHACYYCRLQVRIQMENMRVLPDVRAVIVDEDRHVSHNLDPALVAVAAQRTPLLNKGKLDGALNFQFSLIREPELVQGSGLTTCQAAVPGTPGCALVDLAHHVKQNKILEPPCVLAFEAFKARAIPAVVRLQEILGGFAQQRHFECESFLEIDALGETRLLFEPVLAQPAAV